MINYEDLEKLNDLRQRNIITEEEYEREKSKILNGQPAKKIMSTAEINQYAMFIHLSQLLGSTGIGFVVPIVLWLVKKDESPIIDNHGKIVLNWMISLLIYGIAGAILCFLLVGIPVLIALAICNLVFIIIGSIKAYSGELWKYPLSIEFFH